MIVSMLRNWKDTGLDRSKAAIQQVERLQKRNEGRSNYMKDGRLYFHLKAHAKGFSPLLYVKNSIKLETSLPSMYYL